MESSTEAVLNIDEFETVAQWKEFVVVAKEAQVMGQVWTHTKLVSYLSLSDSYKCLFLLLQIRDTIFVSTAGGERFLSQLKLTKTEHRSRMHDDLLCAVLRLRTWSSPVDPLLPSALQRFKQVVIREGHATGNNLFHDF